MRTHVTITINEFDHPHVKIEHDDEDNDEWVSIDLSEHVSIMGDQQDIQRWVRELAVQVAGLPE